MVLGAMPGVMWLEQHSVGSRSVICLTICFTTSMCIPLPSEYIALKNTVWFFLISIDKERQKDPPKSLFQQQLWTMEKPYNNREKDNYFFNHGVTKWQNLSAEVEICETLNCWDLFEEWRQTDLMGFTPSLCWNYCMDNSCLPALKNDGTIKNE